MRTLTGPGREARFLGVDPMAVDTASAANFNRYAYANNSPYKFTDPDGRYSCAGTAAECAQVDQYVATIDKAKFSPKLNGREQRELRKTTNYLGKAGGAGPVLTVESLPNDTKAHTNQAGKISIDVAKNTSGGASSSSKCNAVEGIAEDFQRCSIA